MESKKPVSSEMLKGTLDMMILRTLVVGDAHGHTVAKAIERSSEDVRELEQGLCIRGCIGWRTGGR